MQNKTTCKPLVLSLVIYWISVATLLFFSLRLNNGKFAYILDDTYIHMAIAKNTAVNGVWGMTPHGFTSSTSSPLWTLLIAAGFYISGLNEFIPLVLSLISGTLMILAGYLVIKQFCHSDKSVFIILLLAIFVTPMPALTIMGMEHLLHSLLTLLFITFSVKQPVNDNSANHNYSLFLIAPFLTMARYEGMFLVLAVCGFFIYKRKLAESFYLFSAGVFPIVAYGLWSVANGWFFFPNSVLLKASLPDALRLVLIKMSGIGLETLIKVFRPFLLLVLAVACSILFKRMEKKEFSPEIIQAGIILFITLLLHVTFASTGWFYRYEAYLVFVGILLCGIFWLQLPKLAPLNLKQSMLLKPLLVVVLLIIIVVLGIRSIRSYIATPRATQNIFQQQYQMGLFLKKFYANKQVALNDIGAPCFLSDIKLLDLVGLGSMETAKQIILRSYNREKIKALAIQKDVAIAVIYRKWLEIPEIGGVPSDWKLAGQWTIQNNIVAAHDTVHFFAVNKEETENLMKNLAAFSPNLPEGVIQAGPYLKLLQ